MGIIAAGLLLNSLSTNKEIEKIKAQSICQQAENTEQQKAKPRLTQAELMTARQIIEGLAMKHKIQATISMTATGVTLLGDVKQKDDILKNYEGMLVFLSDISNLPYLISYTSFCIGSDCSNGIEIKMEIGYAQATT